MATSKLDQTCINTLRFLAADAVQKANSGHPGLPLGAAAMAYGLWTRCLKHNPADPKWPDRDRFILSAGHGSMLLYALLPFLTAPDQQVVPPPQQMDLGQTLLTLFIAATAIGAPLTAGIVLVLLAKFVSKRVPASSAVAPEIPSPKAKPRAVEQSAEMSARAALIWKIVATMLLLIVAAGVLAGLAATFAQFYQ